MTVLIADVKDAPLDIAAHHTAVLDTSAGAVASFIGVVRDHDPGVSGEVTRLDYSAHPDTPRLLRELLTEVAAQQPQPVRLAASHRIGNLAVGDAAVVIFAASAHRAEAFAACREAIERIKTELPVWKRQYSAAGATNWVGIE